MRILPSNVVFLVWIRGQIVQAVNGRGISHLCWMFGTVGNVIWVFRSADSTLDQLPLPVSNTRPIPVVSAIRNIGIANKYFLSRWLFRFHIITLVIPERFQMTHTIQWFTSGLSFDSCSQCWEPVNDVDQI